MKSENYAKIIKSIIIIIAFIKFDGIVVLTNFVQDNYLEQPNIICMDNGNTVDFFVKKDFRSISIKLHPQMVIQFDDYIILLIYLDEYYEQENISFDENNQCQAIKTNEAYVNKLKEYLKSEIISELSFKDNSLSGDEMTKRLNVYISNLAGVSYENQSGNDEKRFCFIEKNGIVRDLDEHANEITNRLFETQLVVKENLVEIESEKNITIIVKGAAQEILRVIDSEELK